MRRFEYLPKGFQWNAAKRITILLLLSNEKFNGQTFYNFSGYENICENIIEKNSSNTNKRYVVYSLLLFYWYSILNLYV